MVRGEPGIGRDRGFDRWVLTVWCAALVVKLALAAAVPLVMDETYYWVWSHHLQLSYFDHPPAVAWLFLLGHPLEGFGHAVRWPGVILGHATLLLWWPLLGTVLGSRARRWWLILVLLSPMLGWGSQLVTPDTPLYFSWSLALVLFLRWADRPSGRGALAVGAALGLGFLSKYTVVLFPPLAFLWLWKERRLRLLRPSWIALALLAFGIVSWPVWWWNAANDWSSFTFQLHHGLGARIWKPAWTLDYVLSQSLLLFPTVAVLALWRRKGAPSWLALFGWGPVLFFLIATLKGRVEANWPAMGYPSIVALAVWGRTRFSWATITASIWAVALIVVASHALWWWIPTEQDRLRDEITRYENLVEAVRTYSPMYAGSYQQASRLSYDTRRPVYQLRGVGRPSFYTARPESLPTSYPYYLIVGRGGPVPDVVLARNDVEVRRINVGRNDVIELGPSPRGQP